MIVIANQKYLRQTPTRLRLVAAAVKEVGSPAEAMQRLSLMNKKAARTIMKVMTQAIANAQHNHNISIDDLIVREILVLEGPQYKRFQPVSRGRANSIIKRTSHVKITLETKSQVEAEKTESKKDEKQEVATENKATEKVVEKTTGKKVTTKKATTKATTKSDKKPTTKSTKKKQE